MNRSHTKFLTVPLDRRDVTVITFANRQITTRRVFTRQQSITSSVLPDFTEGFDDIIAV